jgi:hypothetical protein
MKFWNKLFGRKLFIVDAYFSNIKYENFPVWARDTSDATMKFMNDPNMMGYGIIKIKVWLSPVQ